MNIVSLLEPRPQSSELMKYRDGLLDDVPNRAQAAAGFRLAFRYRRINTPAAQRIAMGCRIVSAIRVQFLGFFQRTSALASDRRDGVDKPDQLRDVVPLGRRRNRDDRRSSRDGEHVVFRAHCSRGHIDRIKRLSAGNFPIP